LASKTEVAPNTASDKAGGKSSSYFMTASEFKSSLFPCGSFNKPLEPCAISQGRYSPNS
jgi:hypothetical protein